MYKVGIDNCNKGCKTWVDTCQNIVM